MSDSDPRPAASASRCPSCSGTLPKENPRAFFPFCSARCRTIDLGNWLDGRYAVPAAEHPDDDGLDDGA